MSNFVDFSSPQLLHSISFVQAEAVKSTVSLGLYVAPTVTIDGSTIDGFGDDGVCAVATPLSCVP